MGYAADQHHQRIWSAHMARVRKRPKLSIIKYCFLVADQFMEDTIPQPGIPI
jgi:hypothetical protein